MCLCVRTEDKLNDRYVVQRPSARASRRKDEFTWYDKVSGELMTQHYVDVDNDDHNNNKSDLLVPFSKLRNSTD